jgi:hypothetical protein
MRRLSFATAMLALVAACHSATKPPPSELFYLMSIDGRPLPTTRSNDPVSDGAPILHEGLILDGRGVATRNTMVQGATPGSFVVTSTSYTYIRNGDVVTIGDIVCGPGVPCPLHSPESGLIDAAGITLMPVPSLSSTAGSVLVYQRSPLIG